MTVWAVSGGAGCGKTFRLMGVLNAVVETDGVAPGQSILALTYMHGARQRLDQRLAGIPAIRGRYLCSTLDSFALSIRERWSLLGRALGQPEVKEVTFDQQCLLAAQLLEQNYVSRWVSSSFPIVLVDEAQDLDEGRLRLVKAMGSHSKLLLAFDDFQCLKEVLRPSPVSVWLPTVCEIEVLKKAWRTNVPALLGAAMALREGQPWAAAALSSSFAAPACLRLRPSWPMKSDGPNQVTVSPSSLPHSKANLLGRLLSASRRASTAARSGGPFRFDGSRRRHLLATPLRVERHDDGTVAVVHDRGIRGEGVLVPGFLG